MSGGAAHWDGPPLEAWEPWTPQFVSRTLEGVDVPWCVVGGWAIDLFLGRETRHHEDIEIAVPGIFFAPLRARLERRFALHAVGDGEVLRLQPGAPFPPNKHQCWVLDEAADQWRLDVMQEPGDAQTWVFRRDERIAVPRANIVRHAPDDISYLSPEAVLLFKAKGMREKDVADFTLVAPLLPPTQRAWLIDALNTVHPDHPWIAALR